MKPKPSFDALMNEVCVGQGWCGSVVNDKPLHVTLFIPENGPVTAEQFVDWLFEADGVDPYADLEKWQKHKGALRDAFIRHMGSDVVDAADLRWEDN